ncbi:MAG: 1-deoxy-D-xylulose-5-phosphate reductoisomerase, partial [Clostridiales bacterium]|nr:1-deoxy-D-xylulose-5-phosphate reductoisomerase [Clostridiales bacterium]
VSVMSGMEGLIAVATAEAAEMVVTAVVGMMGIRPTIAAIEAGKDIALANKETLVTAGHIIMPLAREKGVKILPVDSEHSAIFQSLNGERETGNRIEKILLTASGGPFRGMSREQLSSVTLEDALKHPTWSMGKKVTIDSASLVNKGLEVMEAKWLFDVSPEQIQVVIHPESVIHSMVQYEDGAVIAQLGLPDMRLPIQYALFYPRRVPLGIEKPDFYKINRLTFEKPDTETFMGLTLAIEAITKGGNMPTVFNAANEEAVALFLQEKISFLEIGNIIGESMAAAEFVPEPDVHEILATEAAVRERIRARWQQ